MTKTENTSLSSPEQETVFYVSTRNLLISHTLFTSYNQTCMKFVPHIGSSHAAQAEAFGDLRLWPQERLAPRLAQRRKLLSLPALVLRSKTLMQHFSHVTICFILVDGDSKVLLALDFLSQKEPLPSCKLGDSIEVV